MNNASLPLKEKKIIVNQQFLEELVAKNCSIELQHCTSSIGANVTDVSIWTNSLTSDQMIIWTKCRYDLSKKVEL